MERTSGSVPGGRKVAGARAVSLAIVLAVIMVGGAALVLGAAPAYAYTAQGGIEPNPMYEGNATYASFTAGWSPLEYASGSTLPARLDPRVANPIQVTGADILAPGTLQAQKVTGSYWNATSAWTTSSAVSGQVVGTLALATVNGEPAIQQTMNSTGGAAISQDSIAEFKVLAASYSSLPSTNPAFDYFTLAYSFSGPALSGATFFPTVANASASAGIGFTNAAGASMCTENAAPASGGAAGGGTGSGYISVSFASLEDACGIGLNSTAGVGYAGANMEFGLAAAWPKAGSTAFTFDVTGFAITTAPLTLGPTTWHKVSTTRSVFDGPMNLTRIQPSFTYTSVAGSGYTVAIAQEADDLQNVTVTNSPVNIANATAGGPSYVEQVSYEFSFGLPSVAQVQYGAFKLVDTIGLSGAQYVSVNFAGASYITQYQAYTIGATNTVVSSVVPTTAETWIGIVDYTGSQWDSISSPPGILSGGGIQYLWYELIGLFATIGGGSGWVVARERALRNRGRGVAPATGLGVPSLREFGRRWRPRGIRHNRRAVTGRHGAIIALGLVTMGAAAVALWAYLSGADPAGLAGAFVAGWVVLVAVAGIAFVIYEIAHWSRGRRRAGH